MVAWIKRNRKQTITTIHHTIRKRYTCQEKKKIKQQQEEKSGIICNAKSRIDKLHHAVKKSEKRDRLLSFLHKHQYFLLSSPSSGLLAICLCLLLHIDMLYKEGSVTRSALGGGRQHTHSYIHTYTTGKRKHKKSL